MCMGCGSKLLDVTDDSCVLHPLARRLRAVAATGSLSLRPVNAGALLEAFLPRLLPGRLARQGGRALGPEGAC